MISQLLEGSVGAELAQMTFKSILRLSIAIRFLHNFHFRWNENFLLNYVNDWK